VWAVLDMPLSVLVFFMEVQAISMMMCVAIRNRCLQLDPQGAYMTTMVEKEKAKFVKQRLLQLEDWRTSVDLLKAKAENNIARARTRYDRQIEELVNKYLQAQIKFNGLQKANGNVWGDRKSGFDQACRDLQDALNRAHSIFK
jgi:hypothetical protein